MLILDGRLPVGVRLPAERSVALALGVSRTTATAAYDQLRASGHATSQVGAGTWTAVPSSPGPWPVWVPSPAGPSETDMAHAAPSAPPHLHGAYVKALDDLPRHLHGHGYHPQGLPELRARIADRFTARGLPTVPEQVTITAGALSGVRLALGLIVGRGERVLVEHPSYPNALDAIREAGARAVTIPVRDGWDVDAYAAAARQTAPRAAYLQPDFHNPTGLVLPERDRAALAAALTRARCVVVVDETVTELSLGEQPPPPFAAYLPADAITVGSASKVFWGGLRIGWIRSSADRARQIAMIRATADLGSPVLDQLATGHLLDALEDVRDYRRAELRAQRDALIADLRERLPDWDVPLPMGGLSLWCRLPEPIATPLASAAARYGLRVTPGPRFAADPAFESWLRLPYTLPVEDLRRAVDLLTRAVTDLARSPAGRRVDARLDPAEQLVV